MSSDASTVPPPETEGGPRTASGRPRTRTIVLAAVVFALIVLGAVYWYYHNRATSDDAQITGHIQPVAPRVTGTVTEVDVNENQMVHAGEVLFRLDPSTYQAALEQAEANLSAAQAAAAAARTGVPITTASSSGGLSAAQAGLQSAQAGATLARQQLAGARAQYAAAQAQVSRARADAQNAQATEKRYAQLVKKQEVSALQYDQIATQAKASQAALQTAAAQAQAARQAVGSARAQVQVALGRAAQAQAQVRQAASAPQQISASRSQVALAQAKVAQAQAAVDAAKLNLGYTVVRSPADGLVGNKHVEVGQAFAPGQTALVVVPINDVWVIANFKETQLAAMRPGQRAQVSVDAFGTTLKATVDSIGAGTGSVFSLLPPENATGNYVKVVQRVPVKIVFDSGQDLSRLRPGMSVEATVFVH